MFITLFTHESNPAYLVASIQVGDSCFSFAVDRTVFQYVLEETVKVIPMVPPTPGQPAEEEH